MQTDTTSTKPDARPRLYRQPRNHKQRGQHSKHHRSPSSHASFASVSSVFAGTSMTAVRSAVVPSPTTSQPQAASPLNEPPISVAPSPSAASLPNASSAGTSREHHSAKPNLAILAGAILGGLMLLLLIIGAVVYWCGHRKKEATKSKTVRFAKGIGNTSAGPTKRPDSSDYPDDESNHSYHTASQGHQREQPPVAKHEQPPVPVHGAVQIEMPPHHPMRRRIEPLEADQIQLRDREAATIRKPSIEIAEKTADDDDAQIDRCLSYYLKHHRRASNHPDDDIRASLPSQLEMTLSPTKIDAQDRGDRRSLGFPKTGSLFQKIRRSQIRLNEEALFPAKREARHSSRRVSETVDTSLRDTASSSYDPSTPPSIEKVPRINVPLNWRGSSKPHQDERDVQGSPPHSAFEYAYMAGSHRLPFVPDDAEAAWTPPWQDHSPCRSSALSPRRSGPESVRQRSATVSVDSVRRWPMSTGSTVHGAECPGEDRSSVGGLSDVTAKGRESEEEVGEVIRF